MIMSDTSSRINQSRLTRTDSKFGSKLLLPEAHALETPKSHIRHENSIINSTNRRAGAQKTDEKTHDAKVRKLNKLWAEAGGKLKSRCILLERDIFVCLSKSHFRDELSMVFDIDTKSTDLMKSEQKQLSSQLKSQKSQVKKFIHHIQCVGTGDTYIVLLKQLLESTEAGLSAFKQGQGKIYSNLLSTERTLCVELNGWNNRFETWEKDNIGDLEKLFTSDHQPSTVQSSSQTQPQVPNLKAKISFHESSDPILVEVQAFQDYLAKFGGHYGGWDDLSHAAFIKVRERHGPEHVRFYPSLLHALPTHNLPNLEEHEEWYKGYQELSSKRKSALHTWRARKTAVKKHAEALLEQEGKMQAEREIQRRKRDEVDRMKQAEVKAQIMEWKRIKLIEQEAESSLRHDEERVRRGKEEASRRVDHEKLRLQLAMLRMQHLPDLESTNEDDKREEAEERKQRAKDASVKIKAMQERDDELVKKKRNLVVKATTERNTTKYDRVEMLAEKVAPKFNIQRDPARLFRSNLSEKVADKGGDEDEKLCKEWRARPCAQVMPRRAAVSWRQGL